MSIQIVLVTIVPSLAVQPPGQRVHVRPCTRTRPGQLPRTKIRLIVGINTVAVMFDRTVGSGRHANPVWVGPVRGGIVERVQAPCRIRSARSGELSRCAVDSQASLGSSPYIPRARQRAVTDNGCGRSGMKCWHVGGMYSVKWWWYSRSMSVHRNRQGCYVSGRHAGSAGHSDGLSGG